MDLGKSSHGLRASLCITIFSYWFRTDLINLVGKLPRCLYGTLSQCWEVGTICDPSPSPLIFIKVRHKGSSWIICGFHARSSQIGRNSWLPNLLATGVIGSLFGLCTLWCIYNYGDGIGWISLCSTGLWGTIQGDYLLGFQGLDQVSVEVGQDVAVIYHCLLCMFERKHWWAQIFGCWLDEFLYCCH